VIIHHAMPRMVMLMLRIVLARGTPALAGTVATLIV
jgi:hypothetical protein